MSSRDVGSDGVLVPASLLQSLTEGERRFVVIGAGGWISMAVLDILEQALDPEEFDRRVVILGSRARDLLLPSGRGIRSLALERYEEVNHNRALVFHNAFITRDKVTDTPLDAYVAANRTISDQAFRLCERSDVAGLFLPSSGAVYADNGNLETDLEANPYGKLKVDDEGRFLELAKSRGFGIAIPRIFGLSGEYINKITIYALANFIDQLDQVGVIKIRATTPVYRSYVYVGDLVRLCIRLMLEEIPRAEVFDTCSSQITEMGDFASLVANSLGKSGAEIVRTFDPTLPADRYYGSYDRIDELFRSYGIEPLSLSDQIRRTAVYMRKLNGASR